MQTDEIHKLTRKGICDLLRNRDLPIGQYRGAERRRMPRWPFPGTIELRHVNDDSRQWFGTCHNLSEGGLGFSCDEYFKPGTELEVSFHLPEASFYGRATVRHTVETPRGFVVGVQFNFDD